MAHTTGSYTSSPESQIESDLTRLDTLAPKDSVGFCEELDRIVRSNFTGDYWTISLPNRLETSSARSPVLFAYWAALNILDAEVLFSRLRVRDLLQPGVKAPRSIERHHLFPKAYLAAQGITNTSQVNAIANMAFLDWADNVSINSKSPQEYWPVMTAAMDHEHLKQQCQWHALPVGWEQHKYPVFLERRRELLAGVIKQGFDHLWGVDSPTSNASVTDLIALGESQCVEFKSTARWNINTGQRDKKMENVIAKQGDLKVE